MATLPAPPPPPVCMVPGLVKPQLQARISISSACSLSVDSPSTPSILNIPTQGDLIRQRDFISTVQIDGIPEQLSIYAVSAVAIDFMVPPSSTQSRSGEIREGDTMMLSYSPVTFSAQGNEDAIKAVFDTFKKVTEGNPLRGSITISIVNPADNYNVIHTFELQELTLLNYSPGISADVDHPGTLSFEFTVLPNRIELK